MNQSVLAKESILILGKRGNLSLLYRKFLFIGNLCLLSLCLKDRSESARLAGPGLTNR